MSEAAKNIDIDVEDLCPEISYVSENYARGKAIPWQFKMALKIFLSYLPIPYGFWKKVGLFEHGDVTKNLGNLQDCFLDHMDHYQYEFKKTPDCCLELGPGDSLGHALSAKALGVSRLYLVDAGDYASNDPKHYKSFYDFLVKSRGAVFRNPPAKFTRDSILDYTNSHYLVNGVHDMHLVPDETLDLSFSHAVFEHIKRDEFQTYMNELYRTHKKGSISRHWVDLHDHLGGALNNMRFSEKFWEGKSVGQAGFYTNRMTMKEMADCAESAGFEVIIERIVKWERLPTAIADMNNMFQDKTEKELNVCTFLILMRKK